MSDAAAAASSGRGLRIALYVVSGLLSVLYIALAGPPKLLGHAGTVETFQRYGYSDAFRLFIGAAEVAGGIGLWIPRLAFWAALGLLVIMLGAVYNHLRHGEGPFFPLIAAALLAFVAAVRHRSALFLA